MKLEKVLSIVLWVLLAVSAVLIVSMMTNISENEADPTMGAWINTTLTWSFATSSTPASLEDTTAVPEAQYSGSFKVITILLGKESGRGIIPMRHFFKYCAVS